MEPLLEPSPTHLVSPDVAGWRRQRMPTLPDDPRVTMPPDWVCEILSPSTMRHDRVVKANLYLEHGVSWMWLVDIDNQVLEVLQARDAMWQRINAWGPEAKEAPFDAIALDVGRMFPP